MRAMVMTGVGGPEVLQLQELPIPPIQRDSQIRVRLYGAGVNPVDTKLRSKGTYYPDRSPTVLGCDGAGVVETIGQNVTHFVPGDEVFFCFGGIGGPVGNYAEYAVVEESVVAPKPANWSFMEAAAAPLVLITAWESLFDRGGLQKGQRVLIHAGAGGVGHVAIQLAVAQGARVATTVGSPEKADFVRSLGAELPILYKEQDFAAELLAWSHGEGVDLAFDTVGGKTFTATFPAVKPYGELVTLLQPSSDVDWGVARSRNLRISLELMLTPMHLGLEKALHHQGQILRRCGALAAADQLHIHLDQILPLTAAGEAHRLIQAGSRTGKLVLETTA